MKKDIVLEEAKRLYDLGFAILWLKPRAKNPVDNGWTTGPRKEWKELERQYQKDFNVGVRLGTPSKIGKWYLAAVDLDIKSLDPRHVAEALSACKKITGGNIFPVVLSGRGGGSRHYYYLSRAPFKTWNPARSKETVKYVSPSKKVSKLEYEKLTPKEIAAGVRLGPAWEVSLYSEGRQVVLPPSIHPDSGEAYRWKRPIESAKNLPVLSNRTALSDAPGSQPSERVTLDDFKVETVELGWLPVSKELLEGIRSGKNVTDRSAFLLRASSALLSAGLSQNEVLSVLTDKETFIGEAAYEHAKTESRKRAAEWVYRFTLKKVVTEKEDVKSVFATPALPPRKLSPEEMEKVAAEFKADRDWRQDIVRSKEGKPAHLINNIIHIISNSVNPAVVRRDEFACRDSYSLDTPWGGFKNKVIRDDDLDEIQSWMGKTFGFEPSKNIVESALTVTARQNAFDPVRDWLDALPEWDGKKRLDVWLKENFEAEGDDEYLAQVFRKWMVAMVMRVYEPGAKFDWMPIFEGAQGAGKSSFGRLLVGETYFLDWLPNLHDKDSALSLQGKWGVEMSELSQFRRNELETIKAFVTRTIDKFRPPFGKRLIESPRRCVFFGTTNRQTYLIDETGNRRFKPVVVGKLNFKALQKDRLQLFAEARYLFKEKIESEITLELNGQAQIFERKIHQEKMVEDDSNSMEESMRNFMEKVYTGEVKFDLEKFQILELFEGIGPLAFWRKENKNLQFASKMLKRLGGEVRRIHGRRTWKLTKKEGGYRVLNETRNPDFY